MSPQLSVAPAMEKEAKPITVLCVDDEQTAFQPILESEGYKVRMAKSGSQGIEIFNSEPIDAVILDYWMTDISGIEVAQQIRKRNRTIPIIMLSAYIELLDESLGLVDVWIRKGEQNPKYLLGRLAELLQAQQ
jgi:CheY-like chemotaxis protein